ncbi:MAG TPA: hypothetical protein VFY19_08955, partial [Geminicoccaceae bacterium]|nr:hypothetical protein [Geminicoccaceae bacterium]
MRDHARGRFAALIGALLVLVGLLSSALGSGPADAQEAAGEGAAPVALPEPLTREALRDLLARLSDAEVRELLLRQLDQEIAAAPAPDPAMIGGMERQATTLRESWRAMLAALPELPGVPRFFAARLIGERSPEVLLWVALGMAAIFAVGLLAEQLYLWAVRDMRRQLYAAQPYSAGARLGYGLMALALDFVGIVVFALATVAAFFVLHQGHVPVRLTVMTYVGAAFAVRLIALITCFLLAPRAASLRLLPADDRTARFLYRRIMRLAIAWALIFPTIKLLQELGLGRDLVHLLINLGAAVVVALLVELIWRSREPVARAIRGAGSDGTRT